MSWNGHAFQHRLGTLSHLCAWRYFGKGLATLCQILQIRRDIDDHSVSCYFVADDVDTRPELREDFDAFPCVFRCNRRIGPGEASVSERLKDAGAWRSRNGTSMAAA